MPCGQQYSFLKSRSWIISERMSAGQTCGLSWYQRLFIGTADHKSGGQRKRYLRRSCQKTAGEILRGGGSLFSDMTDEAQLYLFARNFHHQLKAQLLHKEVVVQVVRETTLDPSIELDRFGNLARSVQEPARIAWNFSTTLYFKGARQQPWQLADVRPRVCYVGLVFREDPSPAQKGDSCCAAQMFLNSGNGVVFRGALGPWRSEKSREFHLRTEAARKLIEEVVKTYVKDHGGPPDELFIHARQRFNDEEWAGFTAAVPKEIRLVGVRIRSTQDLRLFRPNSDMPVLRGTAVTMSRREGYLWSTGYIPRLRTYPGFRNAQARSGRNQSRRRGLKSGDGRRAGAHQGQLQRMRLCERIARHTEVRRPRWRNTHCLSQGDGCTSYALSLLHLIQPVGQGSRRRNPPLYRPCTADYASLIRPTF